MNRGVRPFGVSLMVAGSDHRGPALYQVDPSGSYFAWKASAIGKNMVNAKSFLEKRYNADLELDDAVHTALLTLKDGFEGEMRAENVEIGVICALREGPGVAMKVGGHEAEGLDLVFKKLTVAEIRDYLANVS